MFIIENFLDKNTLLEEKWNAVFVKPYNSNAMKIMNHSTIAVYYSFTICSRLQNEEQQSKQYTVFIL